MALVLHGGFTIKKSAEDKMVIPRLDVPIPFYNNFQWSRSNKVDVTSVPTVYENDNKMDTCENNTDGQKVVGFDLNEVKSVEMMPGNAKTNAITRILRLSFTYVIRACVRPKNSELAEHLFYQVVYHFTWTVHLYFYMFRGVLIRVLELNILSI